MGERQCWPDDVRSDGVVATRARIGWPHRRAPRRKRPDAVCVFRFWFRFSLVPRSALRLYTPIREVRTRQRGALGHERLVFRNTLCPRCPWTQGNPPVNSSEQKRGCDSRRCESGMQNVGDTYAVLLYSSKSGSGQHRSQRVRPASVRALQTDAGRRNRS